MGLKGGALKRRRLAILVAISLLSTSFLFVAYLERPESLDRLERDTVDGRFSLRGERSPPDDVVVVGIDAAAFERVGQQWPFTHDVHARVIDNLRRDGVKAIALDIQFSERGSNSPQQLRKLVDAVDRAGNVVASTTEIDTLGNGNAFGYIVPEKVLTSSKRGAINDFLRREIDLEVAYGNFPADPDGLLRRLAYETDGLKSFPVAVAERSIGRRIGPEELGGDSAWIDYAGPPGTFSSTSYDRVYEGEFPNGHFRDKIVVIGAVTPALQDVHLTPTTTGDNEMAGPEVQANAIATALRGFSLKDAPRWLVAILMLALGVAVPATVLWLSPLQSLALVIVAAIGFGLGAYGVFLAGAVVPMVYPLGALLLPSIAAISLASHWSRVDFQREHFRRLLARFLPELVVEQLAEGGPNGLRLEGTELESTVMFCDLRDFTPFAERLSPASVVEVLNRYLSEMSDAILDSGGTLVSYMGDGIMAVFGAPLEQDDHADRALAAASEILTRRLPDFNRWLKESGLSEEGFRMGIGVNSGPVMSGNVGSERRLEYAAIGDTTNTAARLEAMTKGTSFQSYISESTHALLTSGRWELTYVDELPMRGKQERLRLWALPDQQPPTSGWSPDQPSP